MSAGGAHRMRRRVLSGAGAALIGVITAVILWLVGVSWPFAAGFGIIASTLAIVGSGLTDADALLAPRPDPPARTGQRSDIAQLSWSLRPARPASGRRTGRMRPVHGAGVRRLRRFAARRVGGLGLSLSDPADRPELVRLLGADVVSVLVGPGDDVPLSVINACLDALEAIDEPSRGRPDDDE